MSCSVCIFKRVVVRVLNLCAVLCLFSLIPEAVRGEEMMIFPVPSQGKDLSNPDQMLKYYSHVGRGRYEPLKLKDYTDKRIERFETSFEECAPTRNSAANEWSAFGAIGDKDVNAMGRQMWVRYPVFELVFRLYKDGKEVKPDSLDSFRLGLVNNRLPAIWGAWQDNGLLYKVSVMTVPSNENGNYDLYKLEIQNPTNQARQSELVAALDGSPDLRLEDGVVKGLGDAAFVIADEPVDTERILRDWGHCDKRAKGHSCSKRESWEEGIQTYRLGLDGLPVVYRFKAEKGKQYQVHLVSPFGLQGYYLCQPKVKGDQVFEYRVEGCSTQELDYIEFIQDYHEKRQEFDVPLFVQFDGAHDTDGDGYIEVVSGVTDPSRCRFTQLSMIYVFNEGTSIKNEADVYGGRLNDQCVWHIDVGCTPEVGWQNQYYNADDIGFARLKLNYTAMVGPGEIKTYWLKAPPIHRREPVSMWYIGHAFREILPCEAIPPFGKEEVDALKRADPLAAEKRTVDFWDNYLSQAAQFDLPDPVLTDIFLSRLATRAIMDVKISENVWYNACSPFNYFDHAYRDQAYVIYALDLAGLHDQAERLLRVYCMDVKDVKTKGPISFDNKPLQLGMLENGLWLTRPGQYDSLGQNIWCLAQHYKLSGNQQWLETIAYSYIKRAAMWIVNSRHKHMKEVGDPSDPRYGLIEPGAMEVQDFKDAVHMYYMDAFAVLGLKETAEAAEVLGKKQDAKMFYQEYRDMKEALHRSFQATFRRTGLYEGCLWFGVEEEGNNPGMYENWVNNALVWPCGAIDPHDPMWTATLRHLDYQTQTSGGGVHIGWPYIGVDRAVGYLLRNEPEKTLDYFCAYTDCAGGTFSWGEGYSGVFAAGDQPHFWADAQWINLFRQLFVFEDGNTLMLNPALFRRWHRDSRTISVHDLPTHFGVLDLDIQSDQPGSTLDYRFSITPKGDQDKRKLEKIILSPRAVTGCAIQSVQVNGKDIDSFTRDQIILAKPKRNQMIHVRVNIAAP